MINARSLPTLVLIAVLIAIATVVGVRHVENNPNKQAQTETELNSGNLTPAIPEDYSPNFNQAARNELARQMLQTARQEREQAEEAVKHIQQRMSQLEAQLQQLEASGVDLSAHQEKTEAVFEQLIDDFDKANRRLDNAIMAEQASLYDLDLFERDE